MEIQFTLQLRDSNCNCQVELGIYFKWAERGLHILVHMIISLTDMIVL